MQGHDFPVSQRLPHPRPLTNDRMCRDDAHSKSLAFDPITNTAYAGDYQSLYVVSRVPGNTGCPPAASTKLELCATPMTSALAVRRG